MATSKIKIPVIFGVIAALLLFGTVVYSKIEGWSFVDSFYFTGMTITTIGYGDLVPTNDFSKVLTVFFALVGVSFVLYLLFNLANFSLEKRDELRRILNRISVSRKGNKWKDVRTLQKKWPSNIKKPKKIKSR